MLAALEAPINLTPTPANGEDQGAGQATPGTTPIPALEDVASGNALPRAPTPQPSQAMAGPECEENGTCYGDISAATGRPKTVEVHGYYRSNGTYVRGHFRSK